MLADLITGQFIGSGVGYLGGGGQTGTGGQGMEGLVGEEEDFVHDGALNRMLVKMDEGRG